MAGDSLAGSNDNQRWETALKSYDEAIKKHSKTGKRRNGLVQLDKHVRQKIPELVESRRTEDAPNGYLTKEDICSIVEWKITVRTVLIVMRVYYAKSKLCRPFAAGQVSVSY